MSSAASALVYDTYIRNHRPYDPARFVDRDLELGHVRDQVRLIQGQGFTGEPLINYWGVKGIGKTWVLNHVRYLYAYKPDSAPPRPTFTAFYSFPAEGGTPLWDFVPRLAHDMLGQIERTLNGEEHAALAEAIKDGQAAALVKALNLLAQRFLPLILLDNTEHIRVDDWKELGRSLIEPLVASGRVLIVIAGRRQAPRWSRFEVRNKVVPTERTLIRAFSKDSVINQIGHADYSLSRDTVDLVFPYTAGNPQLVDAIARHVLSWSESGKIGVTGGALNEPYRRSLLEILGKSLEQLLGQTPSHLQHYLEAVAPLRFYRLEALRSMLAEQERGGGDHADGYYHQILRDLDQNTEVVWWDRERRAYVTSEVVRQVMSRRQLLDSSERYMGRHRSAVAMYRRLAEAFPQTSEDFIVEILFHQTCLYLAHGNVAQLQHDTEEQLDFATQHLNLERFHILQQQLEGDREIFDLAPEEVRGQLVRELGKRLDAKAQS